MGKRSPAAALFPAVRRAFVRKKGPPRGPSHEINFFGRPEKGEKGELYACSGNIGCPCAWC